MTIERSGMYPTGPRLIEQREAVDTQQPILRDIELRLQGLQKVILEVAFTNPGKLNFPGQLIINITTDFIHPEGTELKAACVAIKAGLFRNRGTVGAVAGPMVVNADRLDNDLGSLESSEELTITAQSGSNHRGNILTASAAEIEIYGRFEQTGGIIAAQKDVQGKFDELIISEQGKVLSQQGEMIIITRGMLGLEECVLEAARGISLGSEEGTFWCHNGRLITPDYPLLLQAEHFSWKNVEAIVGSVMMRGGLGELAGVEIYSKGKQRFEFATADFLEMTLQALEGKIKLKTDLIGSYENCQFIAKASSIVHRSNGTLEFQNTSETAKQMICHEASEISDMHSSHCAGGDITQFADTLISRDSLLTSEETVSFVLENANTEELTVIAKHLQAKLNGEYTSDARFQEGRFRIMETADWSNEKGPLDLSGSQIETSEMTARARNQIEMVDAALKIGKSAAMTSQTSSVKVSRSHFSGNGQLTITGAEGTVHLARTTLDKVLKLVVKGRYAELDHSNIETIHDYEIDAIRIAGDSSHLHSLEGNGKLSGEKSIQLDKICQTVRRKFQESSHWIYEKENDKKADEIIRTAGAMDLIDVSDKAEKIHNTAHQNSHFQGYSAKGDSITLDLHGTTTAAGCIFTAVNLEVIAGDLWSQEDRFIFDQFQVQARGLHLLFDKIQGNDSFISVDRNSAFFASSTWQTRFNLIKSGHDLTWINNKSTGDVLLASQGDQRVTGNTFSQGEIKVESQYGNMLLENNQFDAVRAFQSCAPQGSLQIKGMEGEFESWSTRAHGSSFDECKITSKTNLAFDSAKIEMNNSHFHTDKSFEAEIGKLHAQQVDLTSLEKISVKTEQAFLDETNIVGNGDVSVKTDQAVAAETVIISRTGNAEVEGKDLTLRNTELLANDASKINADEAHLDHVTMQGAHVMQWVGKLTSDKSVQRASESISRHVSELSMQDGEDSAPFVNDHASRAAVSRHSVVASNLRANYRIASYNNNVVYANEIAFNGDVSGIDNRLEGKHLLAEGRRLDLPCTQASVDEIEIKTSEKAGLSQSNIKGNVKFESLFVDVYQANIQGALDGKKVEEMNGAGLHVEGPYIDLEGDRLRFPQLDAKVERMSLRAKEKAEVPFGNFKGDVKIESRNIDAFKANVQGTLEGKAEEEIDATRLHVEGGFVELKGKRLQLSELDAKVNYANFKAEETLSIPLSNIEGYVHAEGQIVDLFYAKTSALEAKAENINGAGLHTEGPFIDLQANQLWLPNMKAKADDMNLKAEDRAYLTQAQLIGGSLNIAAQDLYGPEIDAKISEDAHIDVKGYAGLTKMQGKFGGVAVFGGDFLNLDHAELSAETIVEHGSEISAKNSSQMAKEHLEQHSEGIINNQQASFKAKEIAVKGSYIDNQLAKLQGEIHIETPFFDNREGELHVEGNSSYVKADHIFTSSGSHVTGPGTLVLQVAGAHTERSQVSMEGGTYLLQATSATIDSKLEVKNVEVLTSNNPLNITPKGNIVAQELAAFNCLSLFNQGSITSDKNIGIHQIWYRDPGKVKAGNELLLSSDSSLLLDTPMHMDSSLSLISKGIVCNYAPLYVGKDYHAEGSQIGIMVSLEVKGRGNFLTPGELLFDHTKVRLGGGMAADAGQTRIRVSDIDISGDAWLKGRRLLLEGETQVPLWTNTSRAYLHTPSNFRIDGNLDLDMTEEAINHGSNMLVTKNAFLARKLFKNVNVEHLYSRQVEIGKTHKRNIFGWKKKKRLYATETDRVIDGLASTQVGGKITLNLEQLVNDGGLVLANKIEGVASIRNGIFSKTGRTPTLNLNAITCLPGLPTPKAGGAFLANTEIDVSGDSHYNNGWIEAEILKMKAARSFLNERRVVVEQSNYIEKRGRWFGNAKVRTIETDHPQPGGQIAGTEIYLTTGLQGGNRGGVIYGKNHLEKKGVNFEQTALLIRSVEDRKVHQSFLRAQTLSDNTMSMNFERHYSNKGSDIISRGEGMLVFGGFSQETLFATNVEKEVRRHGKKTKIHSIEMEEGTTCSIDGPLKVETTKGNMDVEGKIGSFKGHLGFKSVKNIHLKAKTHYATNKVRSYQASFPHVVMQSTKVTTSQTSLPHVFAGNGATFEANHWDEKGAQIDIAGKTQATFKSSTVRSHQVKTEVKSKGINLGIKFFGSDAIQKHGAKKRVYALLKEDPAIQGACNLKAAKDGVDYVRAGMIAGAHLVNETAKLYNAVQQGNLLPTLGEHFGITDGQGNFNPRISLSANFSKNRIPSTLNIPSTHLHRNSDRANGNLEWNADHQLWEGAKVKVEGDAAFSGKHIITKSDENTMHQKGRGITPKLTFNSKGIDVGVDDQQSNGKQIVQNNFELDVDHQLTVRATEKLELKGATYHAHTGDIKTPELNMESPINHSSSKQWQMGASTTPSFNVAYARQKESSVSSVTGIRFSQVGTVDADKIHMKGSALENVTLKTTFPIDAQDITERKKFRSFHFNFALPPQSINMHGAPQNNDDSVNIFGTADLRHKSEKALLHPVLTGDNAAQFPEVHRDTREQREKIKNKKWHFGAPMISLNDLAVEKQQPSDPIGSETLQPQTALEEEEKAAPIKVEKAKKEVLREAISSQARPARRIPQTPSFKAKAAESKQQLFLNPVETLETIPIPEKHRAQNTNRIEKTVDEVAKGIISFSNPLLPSGLVKFPFGNFTKPAVDFAKKMYKEVKSSAESFSVYQMPKTSKDLTRPYDPWKARAQHEVVEAMAGMHLIGQGLYLAGEAVVEGAKAACRTHPLTEKMCRVTYHFGKKAIQQGVDKLPNSVKETAKKLSNCDGSSLAQGLVSVYGFSQDQAKQMAKQFVGDLAEVSITAATGGAASMTVKGAKRLIKKVVKSQPVHYSPIVPSIHGDSVPSNVIKFPSVSRIHKRQIAHTVSSLDVPYNIIEKRITFTANDSSLPVPHLPKMKPSIARKNIRSNALFPTYRGTNNKLIVSPHSRSRFRSEAFEQFLFPEVPKAANANSSVIKLPSQIKNFLPDESGMVKLPIFSKAVEKVKKIFNKASETSLGSKSSGFQALVEAEINPISTPYAIHEFINHAEQTLSRQPRTKTLGEGIEEIQEELFSYLPDVSHLSQNCEEIWSILVAKQGTPMRVPSGPVHYFRDRTDKFIAQISNGKQSFIVKDCEWGYSNETFLEIMGIATLKSLELQHLRIPDLVAIGKYDFSRSFLIKNYASGETLEEIIAKGSVEEITQVAEHIGKAMGELRSKGLKFREEITIRQELNSALIEGVGHLKYVNRALHDGVGHLEDANSALLDIGSSKRIQEDALTLLNTFHQKFCETPGDITFGLTEFSPTHFVFDKKTSALWFIDVESVAIDVAKKPIGLSVWEYYECLSLFEHRAFAHGLSQKKINAMKAAFNQGYFSQYSASLPPASKSFFELKSSIDLIYRLAGDAAVGEQINHDVLNSLVDRLNTKIQLKDF